LRFTYASLHDVAQALVDIVCLLRDVDEVSSDRRAAHATRHEILAQAALQRMKTCSDGSLTAQLMEFIASPTDASKPKLSVVRSQ